MLPSRASSRGSSRRPLSPRERECSTHRSHRVRTPLLSDLQQINKYIYTIHMHNLQSIGTYQTFTRTVKDEVSAGFKYFFSTNPSSGFFKLTTIRIEQNIQSQDWIRIRAYRTDPKHCYRYKIQRKISNLRPETILRMQRSSVFLLPVMSRDRCHSWANLGSEVIQMYLHNILSLS